RRRYEKSECASVVLQQVHAQTFGIVEQSVHFRFRKRLQYLAQPGMTEQRLKRLTPQSLELLRSSPSGVAQTKNFSKQIVTSRQFAALHWKARQHLHVLDPDVFARLAQTL